MRLIGLDPGFASFGLVVWEGGHFVDAQVWRSAKGEGKAVDDNMLRVRSLSGWLRGWLVGARGMCVESMSFPRSAAVVHKMGIVWGATVTASDLPVFNLSPQAVRKLLDLPKGASKAEIQACVLQLHPELAALAPGQKTLLEHHYDAAAVLIAWLRTEQGRFLTGGEP